MIVVSEDKKASSVSRAILSASAPARESFMTVTCGNGKEFASHEEILGELRADWYFARRVLPQGNGLRKVDAGRREQSYGQT